MKVLYETNVIRYLTYFDTINNLFVEHFVSHILEYLLVECDFESFVLPEYLPDFTQLVVKDPNNLL